MIVGLEIKKGIRQGCSSSPLLFIMVAEMLSILIQNSCIEGLVVNDRQIIISQLADDTTLFLKNENQIPLALQIIEHLSRASGLQLNLDKCEILALHDYPLQPLYNIKVKSEVKYLGIVISKDKTTSDKMNIWNNIEKCKLILNSMAAERYHNFWESFIIQNGQLIQTYLPGFLLTHLYKHDQSHKQDQF